jgi:TolB-like protein/Tfp pilus assembly protein PilF
LPARTSSYVFVFENYRFDLDGGGLFRDSEDGCIPVALGSRALDILGLLVARRGELVTKAQIFAAVWPNLAIEESNLTVQIAALRRVLDEGRAAGSCIQTVKGRGYRFVAPVVREAEHGSAQTHSEAAFVSNASIASQGGADGQLKRPRISLVVLPFASLSLDPAHGYFADAIIDDLTAALSRIAESSVVARTTAFTYKGKAVDVREVAHELCVRYVIEGSVRQLSDRVQVNVQLIDGETGSHLWADRFDSDRADPAEAQSEIVSRLTNTLTLELIKDAGRKIDQEHAADCDARDLVLSATALELQTLVTDRQARRTIFARLERALVLDPQSVQARIQLALILVSDVANAYSTSIEQDKRRTEQLISEVLACDPNNSEAHRIMGELRRTQGLWPEAQVHLETAVALDPNNATALRELGLTLRTVGKPKAAIPYLERAIRSEVRHRYQFHGYVQLGNCHVYLGHTDQAIEFYRKARALAPDIWYIHLCLAAALGLKGVMDEAKSEIATAVKLKPEVNSIAQWQAIRLKQGFINPQNSAVVEKTVFAGLRLAGFPEE